MVAQDDFEQRVRERAYYLWQKEGSPEGRDQEFWERARLIEEAGDRRGDAGPPHTGRRNGSRVDEQSAESFPASDPPSFTTVSGTGKT